MRSFLDFVEYYQQFIEGFSKITDPLTQFTRKGMKFVWSKKCEQGFQKLKYRLLYAPILTIPEKSDRFFDL